MSNFTMSPELLQGWKVLVVDDEPDSLLVAQTLLEMCGAQVAIAVNGQEGLAAVRAVRPDFIVSDLSMPVMSGWQMIFQLKQTPVTRDIPVIALTAHAMTGDRTRAMEVGFHNYLTKPLRPETFINDLLKLIIDVPELADRLN
jgi:two-component system, cell cycle response regulator DivK